MRNKFSAFVLYLQINYQLEYTNFWTEVGKNASLFNVTAFSYNVSRQLGGLQNIGSAALKDNETILEVCYIYIYIFLGLSCKYSLILFFFFRVFFFFFSS